MTEHETFMSELLKKLGYDVVPFDGDVNSKFVVIKDDKFHFLDYEANESYRELEKISGTILLKKDDEGFHCCPPISESGEARQYHPNNNYDWKYYILWENDEYTELSYLNGYNLSYEDVFEYVNTDSYFAIKYHKHGMSEENRLETQPCLDTIISKKKGISHIEVFAYFFQEKIVVCDNHEENDCFGGDIIVYDKDLNVLYESCGELKIWEKDSKSYLIFPNDGIVYELSEGKEIKLSGNDDCYWHNVMISKDNLILYTEHRYHVDKSSYYDEDGNCWDYNYNVEDIPIKNTEGCIYDLNFKLLRKFNVLGCIVGITDYCNTKVMKVDNSDYNTSVIKYYKVDGENITRYDKEDDEEFSVPDIVISSMDGYENQNLTIFRTRMYSPDIINFGYNPHSIVTKCGIYRGSFSSDYYEKIIDCKYDYIKSLPLKNDDNVYYLGVVGREMDNKYDLYINHKLCLHNYPFERGHAIEVVDNGFFIKFADANGKKGFIRNGEIVFKPIYTNAKVCVHILFDSQDNNEKIEYLYIVSDGELFGICSPSGKLILPMKYSTIYMDDELSIVLVRDFNSELDDEGDESIEEMLDYGGIYEIGYYDEEKDVVVTERANFKDGKVLLDDEDDYVWDGRFIHLKKDDYSGWTDKQL